MSKKTKWTPGPWYVAEATAYPSVKSSAVQGIRRGDKRIVTMYHSGDEHRANAHLIAAAPDLYDLVAKIADLNPLAGEIGPGKLRKLVSEARDVQAKARGEAP